MASTGECPSVCTVGGPTTPASTAADSMSRTSCSTPGPSLMAAGEDSARKIIQDECWTSGPLSQGSCTMWKKALPVLLRSSRGRGKDSSHELSPFRQVNIGRSSCLESKCALYFAVRRSDMAMRVVCVVVGRRCPQHHGQHETPHYAEERERQFVCPLMLVGW